MTEPLLAQSIMDRLVEQVDQLTEDRIERNARIKTLEGALRDARSIALNQHIGAGAACRRIAALVDVALDQERHDG